MVEAVHSARLGRLGLTLAGLAVHVEAPVPVLAVLEATLRDMRRFEDAGGADITVRVRHLDDVWEVLDDDGSLKILAAGSALPQIGGAVVTTIMQAAARARRHTALRATVLERGGRALAMIGDDWESAMTLAAHMHGRGWSIVGGDHALSTPNAASCVQKSLYVNSSSLDRFPVYYRRALEASPWYATGAGSRSTRSTRSLPGTHRPERRRVPRGVVIVDGGVPSGPRWNRWIRQRRSERLKRIGIDWRRVAAAICGWAIIETCDLIEHWFGAAHCGLEHVVVVTDSLSIDGGSAKVALGGAMALAERGTT